jgi:hypothetical protein
MGTCRLAQRFRRKRLNNEKVKREKEKGLHAEFGVRVLRFRTRFLPFDVRCSMFSGLVNEFQSIPPEIPSLRLAGAVLLKFANKSALFDPSFRFVARCISYTQIMCNTLCSSATLVRSNQFA